MDKDMYTKDVERKQVKVTDTFWGNYMELCRQKMIPYQWEALNDRIADASPSGCIRNFRIAAGLEKGEFYGHKFQDSDVAKWIEAVAYTLEWHPDVELEKTTDEVIDLIVSAQMENGYLDTYGIINGEEERWTLLLNSHELYVAGHMIEAAVAYYQATGKDKLLKSMIRFADHIDSVFGKEPGKMHGYDGHPIIEMALMRLYDVTGMKKYKDLAEYFIEERGQEPNFLEEQRVKRDFPFRWEKSYFKYMYYQAGMPVRQQHTAEGHAVRALYLYAGMADVARENQDEELMQICQDIWDNIVKKRMYITGNVGSSRTGEAFTFDYDLPNDTVYGETCASVALAFLAHRMLKLRPDRSYADELERVLYNGMISGVQLDGQKFFYVNPLEVFPEACEKSEVTRHVKPVRQKWFSCACCPPNLARIVASMSEYIYTIREDAVFMHLYASNESTFTIKGKPLSIKVATDYPWENTVAVDVVGAENVSGTLALRLPSWSSNTSVTVNGEDAMGAYEIRDGYLYIDRTFITGDKIVITFDMKVCVMRANRLVRHNAGKVALMRGPIVYCIEETDNGKNLDNLRIDIHADIKAQKEEILGGVVTLAAKGFREQYDEQDALYITEEDVNANELTLKFVPYYAWCNREPGEMKVWLLKA